MSEKAKFASISIMFHIQELKLAPMETIEALSRALCATLAASYSIYEKGVKEKQVDAVEGMTWEEFIRQNLNQAKERCETIRAENESLRF